jgi:hypothetical protein
MKLSTIQGMRRRQTIDSRPALEVVPFQVIAQAKAAFSQRVQNRVAELVWDSLVDDGAPSWHHHLRFEHPCMWIELSISVASARANLHGVMHPAIPGRVELQSDRARTPIAAEVTQSAFRIEKFPRGLVRLQLGGPGGSQVYTDWFYV